MVKIVSIKEAGEMESYDIWNHDDCLNGEGNFLIDGMVVHNSILQNGVRNFNDLLLLNAMGHPGPMQSIPEAVKNRDDKTGLWKDRLKNIHPILLEVLEDTYGVIVFQEQLSALWQRLGGFTAPEAQDARKAVAKKWTHKLKPIESRWISGASPALGEESAKEWWAKMETFGRYAFNKCLGKDTILTDVNSGESMTIEQWYNEDKSPMLRSYTNEQFVIDECVDIHYNGENEVFEIEFDNGMKESVTLAHQFLCEDGRYHEVREIIDKGLDVVEAKISWV